MHRLEATLPESQRKMIRDVQRTDPMFEGKRVLIVDDDRRNIFALNRALEKGINAGAADYVTEAVDVEQLVSLLRVWLCR